MPSMRKKQHRKREEDEGMELDMATGDSLFGTIFYVVCILEMNGWKTKCKMTPRVAWNEIFIVSEWEIATTTNS
jgi:hypothetical protein